MEENRNALFYIVIKMFLLQTEVINTLRINRVQLPPLRSPVVFLHRVYSLRRDHVKTPRVGGNIDNLLLKRESYYIQTLQTMSLKGLNQDNEVRHFLKALVRYQKKEKGLFTKDVYWLMFTCKGYYVFQVFYPFCLISIVVESCVQYFIIS